MLPVKTLEKILAADFKITAEDLKKYKEKAKKLNKDLEQLLLDDGAVDELELYTKIAGELEVPLVTLKGQEIKKGLFLIQNAVSYLVTEYLIPNFR